MVRASLAHRPELRNCVCSLWYCYVALCGCLLVVGYEIHIILYDINHSPIDKIVLPIIT